MILSNKKLKLLIITLLLLIFCFFLGMFKPKAEQLSFSLAGVQLNNYNYSAQTWWNISSTFNKRYKGINANANDYGSFQFWLDNSVVNISNTAKYAKVKGFGFYSSNPNNNYAYSISQVRINMGNNRLHICDIDTVGSYFNSLYQDGSHSYNYDISGVFQFTCYINGGESFDNIEFVTPNIGNNTFSIGIDPLLSIDYYYSDSNSAITNIQNNTNDIKNSISDSNIDNNSTSSSSTSWNNKNASNNTITSLLTLPISLLTNIVNGLQTSCSSFSLGSLFGTNLTMPCINLSSLLGTTLFNVLDILISGFMIYNIAKKLIKIFNDFTNLKSNQIDELYGGGK